MSDWLKQYKITFADGSVMSAYATSAPAAARDIRLATGRKVANVRLIKGSEVRH